MRIVKSNVSSVGPSSERKRKETQERNTGKKYRNETRKETREKRYVYFIFLKTLAA